MINELLANPVMRSDKPPAFEVEDTCIGELRFKRERRWSKLQTGLRILPWIALNPSGAVSSGKGLSGRTMARLAYMWGFDGVATYNLIPLVGSNPKRDILPIIEENKSSTNELIQNNHNWIAEDLKNADAMVVGWGKFGKKLNCKINDLISAIDNHDSRHSKSIKLWCVGVNGDGTPKHAGARGRARIPSDFAPIHFSMI